MIPPDQIPEFVTRLFSREFGLTVNGTGERLVDDLGLDSIDFCDALVLLEKETGTPFPLERFRGVTTVSEFVEVISGILKPEGL